MKLYQTLLICIVFCPTVNAQSYLKKGYVVLNNGDTLKGLVHDLEWRVTPSNVKFQASESSKVESFEVSSIKAFATVRPVAYERHRVQYDKDDQSVLGLTENIPPTNVTAEIFLQALLLSDKSLYYFKDKNGRDHFFIREKSGIPIELLNRKYIRYNSVDKKNEVRTYEKWKQDLLMVSIDCKDLKKKIERAKYNSSYLTQIFVDLNQCKGQPVVTNAMKAPSLKKPTQLGIIVQPFFGKYKYAFGESMNPEVQLAYGLSFEFFSRSRPERISFYSELKHRTFSQSIETYGFGSTNVSSSTIRMINALRLTFPMPRANIFWNIGLLTGYRYKASLGNISPNFKPEPGPEAGFAAGLGIKLNGKLKTSCQLTYEWEQTPFDEYPLLVGHSCGAVIGIQF